MRQDNGVRAYENLYVCPNNHEAILLVSGDYSIRWCQKCSEGYYSYDGNEWSELKTVKRENGNEHVNPSDKDSFTTWVVN